MIFKYSKLSTKSAKTYKVKNQKITISVIGSHDSDEKVDKIAHKVGRIVCRSWVEYWFVVA